MGNAASTASYGGEGNATSQSAVCNLLGCHFCLKLFGSHLRSLSRKPRLILRLWQSSGTGKKAEPDPQEIEQEMMKAMKKLDKKISQRDGKQLLPEDSDVVEEVFANTRPWLQNEACHRSRLDDLDKIVMDKVPGVMKRYYIFVGDAIEIRIHNIQDASEFTIHNHRMNFFSCCLKGGYYHDLWMVSTAQRAQGQEHHYAMNRTHPSMESGMQKFDGTLGKKFRQSFGEGNWYFLHHELSHTVQPRDGSTLTIYIKSKCHSADTWVRSTDQSLPAHTWTKDTPIEGKKEKSDFLKEIWQLLQPTSSETPGIRAMG